MALPDFSMRQLLEAGSHFGHQTHRWNPKMAPYIYGARNNIHILDLSQTVPLLHQALKAVSDVVAGGGRVLFVGTKRQASEIVADAASRSAQYYVNSRWLGGMMTNWKTISNSIRRLRELDELLAGEAQGFTKKERLNLDRERDKLELALGGIRDMGGTPDLMFIVDTNKEAIAIQEAKRLNIPVVAVVDSNSDPDLIDYPIPANDDASRAISLYCDLIAKAAIDGIARQQGSSGIDAGDFEEAPAEAEIETADEAAPAESAAQAEPSVQAEPTASAESAEPNPTEAKDAEPAPADTTEAEAEPSGKKESKAEPSIEKEAKGEAAVADTAKAASDEKAETKKPAAKDAPAKEPVEKKAKAEKEDKKTETAA